MNRVPRYLTAALLSGGACAPSRAFSPAVWSAQAPALMVAALWLLAIGWVFHTLLRYRVGVNDRQSDAQVQLGVERQARALAERALAETHKVLCCLLEQQEAVRDTERRRIARDIHDDLGQNLMALKIELTLLERSTRGANPQLNAHLGIMIRNLDLAIKSLRGIINDLRPPALEAGLRDAMAWQLSEFSRLNGIEHYFSADPAAFDNGKVVDAILFRVLQESLSNVARHAQATEVRVDLTCSLGYVTLGIRDNGTGIRHHRSADCRGLDGIRDRVAAVGGSVSIDNPRGGGCQLCIAVPLPQVLVLQEPISPHGLL